MAKETTLLVYGTAWCPDVTLVRRYLDRHSVAYVYRDIDADAEAKARLLALNGPDWVVPTLVFPDGEVWANPSIRQLADKLGRPPRKG